MNESLGMRRWTQRWGCLVASVLLMAWNSSISAEDWPHWQGQRSDGTWHCPELSPDWSPKESTVRWKKNIGGGYGGIAAVKNRLYVMEYQKADVARKTPEVERICCLDAFSGDHLWTREYPVAYGSLDYGNGPRCTPTVFADRVFTLGALGHVCCLDALSGKLLWSKDPQKDFEVELPTWGLSASPVIYNDLVILHPGGKQGRCYMALDQATGEERWRAGDDPGGYATPIIARTPSGEQLIGWTPEHIAGINLQTGKVLWSIPYKVQYGVSIATPCYAENLVVVCGYWEGSRAVRLGPTPESAKLEWEENRYLRGLMNPPLYKQGRIFILDKQYGVTCFELQNGKKLWDDKNTLTPRGRNPQANFVWLDRDHSDRILALNADGELVLAEFRPTGYHEVGRQKIIGETWACPAFAGTSVYARNDSEIVAVSLLGTE